MTSNRKRITLMGGLLLVAAFGTAAATPTPNGAAFIPRVFNDCPGSTESHMDGYPFLYSITDLNNAGCVGFANLHIWQHSTDAGATGMLLRNDDCFTQSATLVISGAGDGEAGLNIAPWWFWGDGRVNVRTTDGEIACFGGRLPFYNFSAAPHNVHYVKDEAIFIQMTYVPNGLSMASPGTIQYQIVFRGVTYDSPVLNFDMGNASEDPPYGLWGILNDAHAGGFFQYLVGQSPNQSLTATWFDIRFIPCLVGVETKPWSAVKALYR